MQISSINTANSYASRAVSMKAKMSSQLALKDFNKILKHNNVILNAQLTPVGNGTYTASIELAKKDPYMYGIVPVTDDEGYAVSGSGNSVNEALLDMMRTYKGKSVYCSKNGCNPVFTMANYIV